MIHVDDIVISTPVEDILNLIKFELAESGIMLFNRIKKTGDNVMTNCPFHANGQERKPSFGISDSGECHCFACGWSSKNFAVFVSELFGVYDGGDFGKSWLLNHMSDDYSARNIQLSFEKPIDKPAPATIVSDEELDSYRYIHPYMYERHLNDEIIESFDIGYDKETKCLTFPINDLSGNPIYIARRSVNSKFFSLPESKNKPVYAADRFVNGMYKKAVICESILNALICWKWGYPAMALNGTGSSNQIPVLLRLPVRAYLLALDNDDAGRAGIERLKRQLSPYKLLTKWTLPEGKDVNDLDGDIRNLTETFA